MSKNNNSIEKGSNNSNATKYDAKKFISKSKVGKEAKVPKSGGSKDFKPHRDTSDKSKVKYEHNDLNWYRVDAEQERLVSGLSFNNRLGNTLNFQTGRISNTQINEITYNPPGIMQFYFAPAYGGSNSYDSAINQAAEAIYAYIRSELRTTASYDASDIMTYLIEVDSLYSEICQYVRVLLAANKRNFSNMYWPRHMVQAMGFDYDYIQDNYANLVTKLNFIILDMSTKYAPDLLHFLRRHIFLNSNIFRENERENSQMYVPISEGYFHYTTYNAGTESDPDWQYKLALQVNPALVGGATASSLASMDDALTNIATRVHNFMDNSDFNRMSADMLNAYGPNKGIYMTTINTDMVLEPVYSPEWNIQMHNAITTGVPVTIGGSPLATENNDYAILQRVTESMGTVRGWLETRYNCEATDTVDRLVGTSQPQFIFDCTYDWAGDSAAVIEGTRFQYGDSSIASNIRTVNEVGSEICTRFALYSINTDNADGYSVTRFKSWNVPSNTFTKEVLAYLSTFKCAPLLYYVDASDATKRGVFGSTELWTVTDHYFRSNLNKYCIYGEFRVQDLRNGATLKD